MCLARQANSSSKLLEKKVTQGFKELWICPYIKSYIVSNFCQNKMQMYNKVNVIMKTILQ